jgi:hypothetical protein
MFADFLAGELILGYDPMSLAKSAYRVYFESSFDVPKDIRDVLDTLMIMDMGPEFFLPEEKIKEIINLYKSDPDSDYE